MKYRNSKIEEEKDDSYRKSATPGELNFSMSRVVTTRCFSNCVPYALMIFIFVARDAYIQSDHNFLADFNSAKNTDDFFFSCRIISAMNGVAQKIELLLLMTSDRLTLLIIWSLEINLRPGVTVQSRLSFSGDSTSIVNTASLNYRAYKFNI